jgi:hypothetical protein
MNLTLASTLLGTAGVALVAWSLGGPAGLGVAVGGGLGLVLGVALAARQRRLLRTAPERALGSFALGFLTKLMVLLAAAIFFRLAGPDTLDPLALDPVAFCLAFLAASLFASATGLWASAPVPVHDREAFSR